MAQTVDIDAIMKLSRADRLKLVELIWKTLKDDDVALSDEQMSEIVRRDQELDTNPHKAVGHDEMRAKLKALSFRDRK
jgi:putative addiction module component (TIGR02574 family)